MKNRIGFGRHWALKEAVFFLIYKVELESRHEMKDRTRFGKHSASKETVSLKFTKPKLCRNMILKIELDLEDIRLLKKQFF